MIRTAVRAPAEELATGAVVSAIDQALHYAPNPDGSSSYATVMAYKMDRRQGRTCSSMGAHLRDRYIEQQNTPEA